MDTLVIRITLSAIALVAAAYLVWPQVAVWLDRVTRPVCGRCRYDVAGITALRCPECGSDLREVGILTPHMLMRRSPGPRTYLAGWTCLWAIVGIIAAVLVSLLLPGLVVATRSSPVSSPADPALSIDIVQVAQGWSDPAESRTFALKLTHDSRTGADGTLEFDWPESTRVRSTGSAAGVSSPTIDSAALTAWLRAAGAPSPDTAGPDLLDVIRGIAAQPLNMATDVASPPSWNYAGSSISVRRQTPWWVQPVLGSAWLVIWAAVTWWLWHRVTRRRPAPPAAAPQPS